MRQRSIDAARTHFPRILLLSRSVLISSTLAGLGTSAFRSLERSFSAYLSAAIGISLRATSRLWVTSIYNTHNAQVTAFTIKGAPPATYIPGRVCFYFAIARSRGGIPKRTERARALSLLHFPLVQKRARPFPHSPTPAVGTEHFFVEPRITRTTRRLIDFTLAFFFLRVPAQLLSV